MTADELLAVIIFGLVLIAAALSMLRARRLARERDTWERWWGAHTMAEIDEWRRDQ